MSEEILQPAIDKFAEGDLEGAVQMLDDMCKTSKDIAAVHHTYAEFANMLNVEAQDDIIPGGKIMMAYKKAMNLDEENDEYIVDFADFALESASLTKNQILQQSATAMIAQASKSMQTVLELLR